MELDEVSQLLDVSKEQYDEILSIVQRHTDETVNWLGDMAAEFGWVGRAGSNGSGPENIFSITMVSRTDGDNWTKAGLLLAHRPEVVRPKISKAAGLKKRKTLTNAYPYTYKGKNIFKGPMCDIDRNLFAQSRV